MRGCSNKQGLLLQLLSKNVERISANLDYLLSPLFIDQTKKKNAKYRFQALAIKLRKVKYFYKDLEYDKNSKFASDFDIPSLQA